SRRASGSTSRPARRAPRPPGRSLKRRPPPKSKRARDMSNDEDIEEKAVEESRPKKAKSAKSGSTKSSAPAEPKAAAAPKKAPAPPPGDGRVVHLRIRRQDGADKPETRRWEEYKVPYLPQMNVNSALEQIRKYPKTVEGKEIAPVVWEAACLE